MSRYYYILKLTKDKCELKVNIHFLIILSTTPTQYFIDAKKVTSIITSR